MRIYPICSSSKGNCTYIGDKKSGILIDIGCSYTAFSSAILQADVDASAIKAVVITHEHTDHVNGLKLLTKRLNIPVFASVKTLEYLISHDLVTSTANLYSTDDLPNIALDAEVKAFRTPHDSVESVGYTIRTNAIKIGFCTDLGEVTEAVRTNIIDCDTVFLEANYELSLLNANPRYPMYLKKRISGDHGHLANSASAKFCSELVRSKTKQIILGHLSQENNTPETAYKAVSQQLFFDGMKLDDDYLLSVAPVMNKDASYIAI